MDSNHMTHQCQPLVRGSSPRLARGAAGFGVSLIRQIAPARSAAAVAVAGGATAAEGRSAADAPADASGAAREPTAQGPARVWLLDDEEPLVRVGKRLLERLGYVVTGFSRALDAVDAVRASPADVDVFITDLNMPDLSGFEVARLISAARVDLPIILLSGAAMSSADGVDVPNPVHRLSKPYTRESLGEAVARALRTG